MAVSKQPLQAALMVTRKKPDVWNKARKGDPGNGDGAGRWTGVKKLFPAAQIFLPMLRVVR